MTAKPIYDFATQKAVGLKGEQFLDTFFASAYLITSATESEQRREIDRWFENRESGHRFSVEFKTDATAARTHHAFIETVSVLERGVRGWLHASQAEYLVYFIPGDAWVIYVLKFEVLRKAFPAWAAKYQLKQIPNRKYTTCGLLVPLAELERIAVVVY